MGLIVDPGSTQTISIDDGELVTVSARDAAILGSVSGMGLTPNLVIANISKTSQTFGPYPKGQYYVTAIGDKATATNSSVSQSFSAPNPYANPLGLSWINDTLPNIDLYVLGFSAEPTMFFDPSATASRALGTFSDPFTTQAQVQLACTGDMSGQVLGIKRGTTLRVTGTEGLALSCYGSAAKPFIICPYGNATALPIITAGVVRSGWIVHAGSIYKITGVAQNTDIFQNDQRLWKKTSLAGITGEGMSFYDSGTSTLYAWAYGSIDPNTATMETQGSEFAVSIRYSNVAASGNVHVVGIDARKGRNISLRAGPPVVLDAITSVSGVWFIGCRGGQAGYDAAGLTAASDAVLMYGVSDAVRATNCMMIGCEGYDCLNNAFETANMDGLIHDSNYGHDVGGNSILELWSSCSNCQVRNNTGERANSRGRIFTAYHAGGIWATVFSNVAGTTTSHAAFQGNAYDFNIIRDAEIQGIEIYGGTGSKVRQNTFYNSVGISTNRLINIFTNCTLAGACDAEVSNNVAVCGNTGNRFFIDILQGAATSSTGAAITATVTGDNNAYLQYQGVASAGLRCNGVGTGASVPAPYKTAAAPFDANCVIKLAAQGDYAPAFISDTYHPLTALLKVGGKTGLPARRYKDGYPYDPTVAAVGALGN